MRMYDIILNKRDKKALSDEEIQFFIEGYVKGEIPDYQVSALLMAIYLNGLNSHETSMLTKEMTFSGDVIDLSEIDGIKVDKHSTGGVGDKTTLVIAPIVASLGVKVAKMSGRGLGHTGGTIDKLESIPGFNTSLCEKDFFDVVNKVGVSVIGQTGNLVPADKLLYSLRDVTATVGSIPLIASSIMSKKIAAGSDCILLDVKVGSGAFMKSVEDATLLAKAMVSIGESANKSTIALISDMNRPLGKALGNSLEVIEAIDTLKGNGPKDLTDVCVSLATNMLYMAEKGTLKVCEQMVLKAIEDGSALQKLKEMVKAQGGDEKFIDNTSLFEKAPISYEVKAQKDGYISEVDAENYGNACVILGAGREQKTDSIDYSAGILISKNVFDYVKKGETILTCLSSSMDKCLAAEKLLKQSIQISNEKPKEIPHILARITNRDI